MRFPRLSVQPSSSNTIDVFRGYNHNLRIGDGELYDMENLTADCYPVLSPREARTKFPGATGAVRGMACLNGLCYVEGNILHYGEGKTIALSLTEGEKQLVPFGAYLIIMPDKLWVNTVTGESGDCERRSQFQGSFGVAWCMEDGTPYETVVTSETAPENTVQMWVQGSTLMGWNETLKAWTEVKPSYLKLIGDGVGADFENGTRISFHTHAGTELAALFGTKEHEIIAGDRDWLVFEGTMEYNRLELHEQQFELIARMPMMDFVFEHENRLWGCRYGLNNNGEFVNEIYASALGDFKKWHCYQGVSTDCYTASCGTDGKWTGAIKAMGYPLFFKENYIHKVYGSYPANYQVQVTPCNGVREGSEKSLAVVDGVLYYHGLSGVYAYDGSLPVCVSEAFGTERYRQAVSGRLESKYYISMKDSRGASVLFCYDTQKRLWHKEDGCSVVQFATVGDVLYSLTGDRQVLCVGADGENAEQTVPWFAETGIIGLNDPKHKYILSLNLRLSAQIGTQLRFYAQYDSSGHWLHIGSFAGTGTDSLRLPLRVQRCDHLRLRIEGEGDAKIYSMTINMARGSELR